MKIGFGALALVLCATPAFSQDAQIAVAANFTEAAQDLADAFAEQSGTEIGLSFASTGQLYTQIEQGAPFAGFLAADSARPTRLAESRLGLADSQFTYAVGRIALYSVAPERVSGPQALEGQFNQLAIAEPAAAPYGLAAEQTLENLDMYDAVADRLVIGQNIAQAYQFVATGNAELGFVALSQIMGDENGSRWIVPENLHAPITQDAILVADAPGLEAARSFFDFLRSQEASEIIAGYGYATPAP